MKKLKKIKMMLLAVFFIGVFIFSKSVYVQAESGSKADVEKSVNQFLSYIKKSDFKKMNKMILKKDDKLDYESLKTTPSMYKYIKEYNKMFSYEIKSISIKEDSATVKIKASYVNSKDMASVLFLVLFTDAFDESIDTSKEDYFDTAWGKAWDVVKSVCEESGKDLETKEGTITIKLAKKNNVWRIKKVPDELKNIFSADIPYSLENLGKEMGGEE